MQLAIYDVFAEKPYSGNQAAVVRVGHVRLSDSQLVALAGELSLAETALSSIQDEDPFFRFATMDRIVNRCGHATLAGVADHVFSTVPRLPTIHREWKGRYRVGTSVAEWNARAGTAGRADEANGLR